MVTPSLWVVDAVMALLPYSKRAEKPRDGWITPKDYTVVIVAYNGYEPTYLGEDEENVIFATDGRTKTDALIKALESVETPYVVILDGDTVPGGEVRLAVQALADSGADIASVKVLPTPLSGGILEKMQHIEYSIAMRARRWSPWLISGAMFIARTESLKRILEKHSGDFEGEDLEIGLLAKRMDMKAIHVDFPAYTEVPSGLGKLIMQRIRWTRGFAKLSIRFKKLHAFIPHMIYWWVPFALMTPLKMLSLDTSVMPFAILYTIYLAITVIAGPPKTPHILLFPIYGLINAIVVPVASALHAAAKQIRKRSAWMRMAT